MKRAGFLFLMACLFLPAHSIFAQSPSDTHRRVILTEGVAEVSGQNDSVRISLSVVTEGPNLEQAGSENAEKMKRVIDTIRELNVPNLDFKTSNYRVVPKRDHKARPPEIVGYEVYNTIEVKLEELDADILSGYVSKIIGNALEHGANQVLYIQSYIKNRLPLEKEALAQATREARERAETLARAAGVRIKQVVEINSGPDSSPPGPHMLRTADIKAEASSVSPPVEIGESLVRAHVRMVFEME